MNQRDQHDQHDRTRLAERAAENNRTGRRHSVMPPATVVQPGPLRSRKAVRMTATQRDSQGRLSAWSRSPYAPRGGWR